jgi:purine-binding chemotaxis protein CheW
MAMSRKPTSHSQKQVESMSEKQATHSSDGVELIAFRIGAQEFCVDIVSVREIRGWTPATALPHSPAFVRGVINLRGVVLPIVDLAARLGLASVEPTSRHVIVVAQVGKQIVGLLVDAVSEILTVADDMVQPTPDVASTMAKTFVRGVLAIDQRMISLIALDEILPKTEILSKTLRDAA